MTAAVSVPDRDARDAALREPEEFRVDFRACLTRWGDELFEIGDAVLCSDGPVRGLADLSLTPEHTRSHGSVQRAMNDGRTGHTRRGLLVCVMGQRGLTNAAQAER